MDSTVEDLNVEENETETSLTEQGKEKPRGQVKIV